MYTFKGKLWIYNIEKSSWYFITLPKKIAAEIKAEVGRYSGPWGTVKVKATIWKTTWETSLFRDKKLDSYLLPVKASIRKKEKLEDSQNLKVNIEIIFE